MPIKFLLKTFMSESRTLQLIFYNKHNTNILVQFIEEKKKKIQQKKGRVGGGVLFTFVANRRSLGSVGRSVFTITSFWGMINIRKLLI